MSRRNTTSTAPFTQSGVASSFSSVYLNLVAIELALITIKYHDADPFKECLAILLIFIIAIFCHAIALTTKTTCWLTTKLFHVSGVIACEALLWLLVTELFWCILINVLMLLIMTLIFYKCIWELLSTCFGWKPVGGTSSTHDEEVSETQQGIEMEAYIDEEVTVAREGTEIEADIDEEDLEAQEGNAFHSLFALLLYSPKVPDSAF